MTASRVPLGVLDDLEAALAAALEVRSKYPSAGLLEQCPTSPTDVDLVWSDGGRSGFAECYGAQSAAAIVAAVNAAPLLLAAVRAVEALHHPEQGSYGRTVCASCMAADGDLTDYPYPTVAALSSALGAEGAGDRG